MDPRNNEFKDRLRVAVQESPLKFIKGKCRFNECLHTGWDLTDWKTFNKSLEKREMGISFATENNTYIGTALVTTDQLFDTFSIDEKGRRFIRLTTDTGNTDERNPLGVVIVLTDDFPSYDRYGDFICSFANEV